MYNPHVILIKSKKQTNNPINHITDSYPTIRRPNPNYYYYYFHAVTEPYTQIPLRTFL
jgi:hypothetical protein